MKKPISLSIAKPCSERWEHFTPDSRGRFCSACHKNVVDFTKRSDEEILDFFSHTSAQSCGRFRPDQLKQYTASNKSVTPASRFLIQTSFLSLFMFLLSKQAYPKNLSEKSATQFVQSQERIQKGIPDSPGQIIAGTVINEYKEPLPGINIVLRGTTVGTTTDAAGNFEFPQELKAGDVLVFSFIGYEAKEYVVTTNASSGVKIALITLQVNIMGEVAIDRPYTAKPTGIAKWWQKVKSVF